MSLITDRLPDCVEIGGRTYRINTDFRVSLSFHETMLDPDLSDYAKLERSLELYYPEPPADISEAISKGRRIFQGRSKAAGVSGGVKLRYYLFL